MVISIYNQLTTSPDIILHNKSVPGKRKPHEYIFISIFLRNHLKDWEIGPKFIGFVEQYFPKYLWDTYMLFDMERMLALECGKAEYILESKYINNLNVSSKDLNHAFELGEIVTNFCIQYLNYSLIGCGGSKAIITAQDRCDKKFEEFLSNGGVLAT